MPLERAILCGSVADRNLPFGGADPLRLTVDGANVHLRIDDLRWNLGKPIPPVLLDLLEIAAYVYAADQATARPDGGADFVGGWRRRLFFRVPVREPDRWGDPRIGDRLAAVLSFLSEDEYHFEFVPGRTGRAVPAGAQLTLAFDATPFDGDVQDLVLFSGGLDSLAEAVREAVVDRRKVLLVNHRATPKVSKRHAALVRELAARAGSDAPRTPASG